MYRLEYYEVLKKGSECFESLSMKGKIVNHIKTPPFVLSSVEGLREIFSASCWSNAFNLFGAIFRSLLRGDAL